MLPWRMDFKVKVADALMSDKLFFVAVSFCVLLVQTIFHVLFLVTPQTDFKSCQMMQLFIHFLMIHIWPFLQKFLQKYIS